MPLGAFIAEVMQLLTTRPEAPEVCVENVTRLRDAAATGNDPAIFKGFNDAMAGGH